MAGIIEVFVGGLIGFGASYLLRIYDRKERKINFINGVQAELLELLPRIVNNVYVMKNHLGNLDHEVLKWIDSKDNLFPGYDIGVSKLLIYPPEEVLRASAISAAQKAGRKPSLKKFYIDYIDRNIDILPLIDDKMQLLIINIMSRLKLVNQEIDLYQFYFEKTFDPESCSINEIAINTNLDNSINLLSKELIRISDSITNLLSLIREVKCNRNYSKLNNLLVKIGDFIKNRRL